MGVIKPVLNLFLREGYYYNLLVNKTGVGVWKTDLPCFNFPIFNLKLLLTTHLTQSYVVRDNTSQRATMQVESGVLAEIILYPACLEYLH